MNRPIRALFSARAATLLCLFLAAAAAGFASALAWAASIIRRTKGISPPCCGRRSPCSAAPTKARPAAGAPRRRHHFRNVCRAKAGIFRLGAIPAAARASEAS